MTRHRAASGVRTFWDGEENWEGYSPVYPQESVLPLAYSDYDTELSWVWDMRSRNAEWIPENTPIVR